MRRPHVYERSAPRLSRSSQQSPAVPSPSAARNLASGLSSLLTKAEAAGLPVLAALIEAALSEARREAARPPSPAAHAPPLDRGGIASDRSVDTTVVKPLETEHDVVRTSVPALQQHALADAEPGSERDGLLRLLGTPLPAITRTEP